MPGAALAILMFLPLEQYASPNARSELLAHDRRHSARDFGGVFVLPDSDNRPPCVSETSIRVRIAATVALDLLGPVPRVHVMLTTAMVRASVPEAPVDEHRYLCEAEHHVCPASKARERLRVHSIAQSHRMESTPHGELWPSVLAELSAHPALDRLGRRERLTPALRHAAVVPSPKYG